MNYSIYDEKGQIQRVVYVNNIEDQLNDNEFYIEGIFDDSKYYIENNELVEIPEKPDNDFCVFDYKIKQWVDTRTEEQIYEMMVRKARVKRLALISETDWTQLPDVPESTRAKWQIYRQALRDITAQSGFPETVVWPEPPQ